MEVQIRHVTKRFGKKRVLTDLSLDAKSGMTVGILGCNGSGKSTLFGVLNGLLHGEGSFLCDGVDLMKDRALRAKRVGYVPQDPPLIEELSAKDNLRLWYTKEQLEQQLQNGHLKMLGIDAFLNVTVSKLSGGMKKRLSIGCAIAHDPQILLLDEPCSALDLVCKQTIYTYIASFTANGGIALLATHDAHELELCDEVYLLKQEKISRYTGSRRVEDLVAQLSDE